GVEVCPVTGPGGVNAEPSAVIAGIIDILRTGDGPEASRKWANACVLSGECIKACDYGVNPRFLLGMARVAMARRRDEPGEQRRQGVEGFRKVAREVNHISQMQLGDALLARLGQKDNPQPGTPPDFVFYTGCNVLKTPHIALLALDIMDALGVTYQVLGGADALLRHRADANGRHRHLRPLGRAHDGQARAPQVRTGGVLVSELSRAIHRDDVAHHREDPRGAPVRDDTVHAVPARKSRPAAAAARPTARYARCLASPPRDQGRGRGRRGHPAGSARGRADRSPATGGRTDEQLFPRASGLSARAAEE